MLMFRIGDAAERRPETDPDAILRDFAGPGKPSVLERHFCGYDRELRIPIESFQPVMGKVIFRDPIDDLAGAMGIEERTVEAGDRPDAALFELEATPKIFAAGADTGDGAEAGNDGAPALPFTGRHSCSPNAVSCNAGFGWQPDERTHCR